MSVTPAARQSSSSLVTSLLTILRTVQSCHVTITRHSSKLSARIIHIYLRSGCIVCCVLVNIQLLVLSPLLISAVSMHVCVTCLSHMFFDYLYLCTFCDYPHLYSGIFNTFSIRVYWKRVIAQYRGWTPCTR